jgi:hypothetical protein
MNIKGRASPDQAARVSARLGPASPLETQPLNSFSELQ